MCHFDAKVILIVEPCKYFASYRHKILQIPSKCAIFANAMEKNYTYVEGAQFPYQYKYEHMAVTTDCVIFTYEDRKLKVLLVKRGGEPYKGQWALPGGFLKNDETAREGAMRELQEETGLVASAIGELGVFSDIDRDPRERVITIAWYALVRPAETMPMRQLGSLLTISLPLLLIITRFWMQQWSVSEGISISSRWALNSWMTLLPSLTFSASTK